MWLPDALASAAGASPRCGSPCRIVSSALSAPLAGTRRAALVARARVLELGAVLEGQPADDVRAAFAAASTAARPRRTLARRPPISIALAAAAAPPPPPVRSSSRVGPGGRRPSHSRTPHEVIAIVVGARRVGHLPTRRGGHHVSEPAVAFIGDRGAGRASADHRRHGSPLGSPADQRGVRLETPWPMTAPGCGSAPSSAWVVDVARRARPPFSSTPACALRSIARPMDARGEAAPASSRRVCTTFALDRGRRPCSPRCRRLCSVADRGPRTRTSRRRRAASRDRRRGAAAGAAHVAKSEVRPLAVSAEAAEPRSHAGSPSRSLIGERGGARK